MAGLEFFDSAAERDGCLAFLEYINPLAIVDYRYRYLKISLWGKIPLFSGVFLISGYPGADRFVPVLWRTAFNYPLSPV